MNIQPLPQVSHSTCASTLGNQILVCGYNTAEFFNYNPYQNIFSTSKYSFTASSYKYIFENWIVVFGNALFEIDENLNLIKRQDFKDPGTNLNSSATFRRGKNIYFLLYTPKLYRIKTDTKAIESINLIYIRLAFPNELYRF